jgi:hypothetical protein
MNELVNYILRNDNFPILFSFNDFEKIGYKKDEFDKCVSEGIAEKYIDYVYNDIYTIDVKYRKKVIPQGILAQKIVPDSYISMYYVLCDYNWIPEMIFSITSVTKGNDRLIDTSRYGTYIYTNVYEELSVAGIHNDEKEGYKIATPLRALCDLMYFMKKEWISTDSLYEVLRIDKNSLEETLSSKDFDELQGAFGIKSIEKFLDGIRKELTL